MPPQKRGTQKQNKILQADCGVLWISTLFLYLHGQVHSGIALDQPAKGDNIDIGQAVAGEVFLSYSPTGLDDDVWELLLELS